jgi:DNA-binding response OmpR family regulator
MKKILFIEDDNAIQKTLGEGLRNKGYDVVSATDGEEGLEFSKDANADLVILDLILPKMHGLKVLENMRKEPATAETPVIILTNLENINEVEQALEFGATTYLVKANYSLEEVLNKIEQSLGE